MVRIAFGKQRLAMSLMEFDISIVISFTISLLSSSMRISASITASAATPFTMAMMVPLPPCEVRLLTIVYNSPLLGAVSSIQMLSPIFSGKTSQSSACESSDHSR